jgi:hypothetical protein
LAHAHLQNNGRPRQQPGVDDSDQLLNASEQNDGRLLVGSILENTPIKRMEKK